MSLHNEKGTLDYAPLLRRALRAIGFADVRFGILPAQSRFRGNDENVAGQGFQGKHRNRALSIIQRRIAKLS